MPSNPNTSPYPPEAPVPKYLPRTPEEARAAMLASGGITEDMIPASPDTQCFYVHDGKTVVEHHSHTADGSIVSTVWTDDDFIQRDVEKDDLITTGTMHDTSATTSDRLYAQSGWQAPTEGAARGFIMQEVSLEVPVHHDKLAYALAAVENVIAGRRAFGYTIPEESRTVTTVGNEIVIRWQEHS